MEKLQDFFSELSPAQKYGGAVAAAVLILCVWWMFFHRGSTREETVAARPSSTKNVDASKPFVSDEGDKGTAMPGATPKAAVVGSSGAAVTPTPPASQPDGTTAPVANAPSTIVTPARVAGGNAPAAPTAAPPGFAPQPMTAPAAVATAPPATTQEPRAGNPSGSNSVTEQATQPPVPVGPPLVGSYNRTPVPTAIPLATARNPG